MPSQQELAGLEYHGIAGASHECQTAIVRLLQCGECLTEALILTHRNEHCLLLKNSVGDQIAIKSGFASGYRGEGSHRFSYVLQLMKRHGLNIDECDVDKECIERLDRSALTRSDLENLGKARRVRPYRWPYYIDEKHHEKLDRGTLWDEFPFAIPYSIVDSRLMDIALAFWQAPGDQLLKAYRRLEDTVRTRTNIDEHGTKLFARVFNEKNGSDRARWRLSWTDLPNAEKEGRANLFVGAFKAYRNPRAHKELESSESDYLTEFLLVNHLYRLEREAVVVEVEENDQASEHGASKT